MRLLDLTLNSPAENLALDEALLDWAEESTPKRGGGGPRADCETLRLWEPAVPFVVLGRGSRVEEEVDLAASRRLGVPVFRRASGGAAVVVGPGCLMYAVVLSYILRPELKMLDAAHRFVLGRVAEAASACIDHVAPAGTSDLVVTRSEPRKFSGNSLRCKRTHFLYHGTLMYDFDVSLIEKCLRMPPRQPDYRAGRSHSSFVTNLPATAPYLRAALVDVWQATTQLDEWPRQLTASLAQGRYNTRSDWTLRHFHER